MENNKSQMLVTTSVIKGDHVDDPMCLLEQHKGNLVLLTGNIFKCTLIKVIQNNGNFILRHSELFVIMLI